MVVANVTAYRVAARFVALRPRLEAVAARITGDRDEAADIASEAYIALVERGPAEEDEVAPWLFTTTRNRALNRVRDRARAARRPAPEAVTSPSPTPTSDALSRLLAEAASRVSRRDRTVLRLRCAGGASYAEVAAALGVTESNARVVVHRAERRFRREAVRLLAEHHGVSAACRESLADSAVVRRIPVHPGCHTCAPVIDEVQALASHGVIPAVAASVIRRYIDRMTVRVGSRVPLADATARLTEGAAVLVAVGSIALGTASVAPATPSPPAATSASVVGLSDGVANPVAGAESPPVGGEEANAWRSGFRPDASIHARAAVPAPPAAVYSDQAGDGAPLTAPVAAPVAAATPWAPRVVRDAFASETGTGADIHRFEVSTISDTSGRPSGLRFVIDVDGAPSNDMGYTLTWAYLDTPCSSDRLTLSYASSRDGGPPVREAVWEHSCSTDSGYESAEAIVSHSIEGSRVTLDLPFARIPAEVTVGPAPGVALDQLSVIAIDYQRPLSVVDGDRAPDENGIAYRIEKEPGPSGNHSAGTS